MIPVLLCIIFAVSAFMTVTASAATAGQDGVEAELTFSKNEYKAGENLSATLTVTNHNQYSVQNVQTKIVLPEGMKMVSGSLPSEAFTLAANETKTYEVTLAKDVVPDTPKKDSDPGTGSTSSKTAKTGDDSDAGIFIVLMLLSGGVLVFVMVRRKRLHGKGVIPFILCFIVLGAVMLPVTADAAGKQKEFTVGQTVKVDGKEATVKAVISYEHLVHSSVTVNGGAVDNPSATGLYAEGETVTITANQASEGQHFSGWTVVSGGAVLADRTQATTTFEMPANDVEITADYEVNVYTIEAAAGENGKIDPEGSVSVTHNDNMSFNITPNPGFYIQDVEVDDESVGNDNTYTFNNVTSDHTISVTFVEVTGDAAMTSGELREAVTNALNGGRRDIVITGDLTEEQQKAAGAALVEWCKRDYSGGREGTISLTFPDVTKVFDYIFGASHEVVAPFLKSLNLPQATRIGEYTFAYQKHLEKVNIPKVETIGIFGFTECDKLKNVNLPAATTLGWSAFSRCDNLESITAPLVTEVHPYAFFLSPNLTSLTFGSAMTSWGGQVFGPDDGTIRNITLTLAKGQKELLGGRNDKYPSDECTWTITNASLDMVAGVNKEFCGYTFKEIKLTE